MTKQEDSLVSKIAPKNCYDLLSASSDSNLTIDSH